ncbi:MAG TPA: nucleoside phosphorylase [Flexilinea sp.]|jgi:uridine phosphorylase|nr:nucleoside phosphorylase [Flexilinea sp.]HOG22430.1 nucleoside phosphorylase [Flexilinea sp.]HOU20156.1 nucleoside phosphorylase [Flexilinea sp.]HQF80018.1 nucleoside phosphorylase [Flexilinea sp.]HQJ01687.1 nucleoside phosphorylase [Flexilinea sp.]
MADDYKMMHLGIKKGDVGRYVFLPGSVERATLISEYFDHPRKIAHNREFLTYSGTLDGVLVSVTSTGIGGPSTTIAIEELFQCGADTMIRVGSCASTSPIARIGDVMIPNGSVRMEGTGVHYLPMEFPAVPDFFLLKELEQAAIRLNFRYNVGINICKDSFYTEVSPETKPVYYELKAKWEAYEKGGATHTCMECAPLFLAGASLGIRTAAVLICATNYKSYSNDDADYPRGFEHNAIKTGIEAMRSVIHKDRQKEQAN